MPKGREIRVATPSSQTRLLTPEERAMRRIIPVTESGAPKRVVGIIPSFVTDLDKNYERPIRPGAHDYRKIPSLIAGVRVMPGDHRANWKRSQALRPFDNGRGAGMGHYPRKPKTRSNERTEQMQERALGGLS